MSGDDHNQAGEARLHRHSEASRFCTHIGNHCCVECCEPGGVRGEATS